MKSNRNHFRSKCTALCVLSGAILCTMLLPAGSVLADDWPTYQHDSAHTGRSSAAFDPSLLKKAWGTTDFSYSAVVAGNSIYAIRGNGRLTNPTTITSFNLQNGSQNWSYDFAPGIDRSNATYADGMLVFLGETALGVVDLYVVDAAT